MKESNYNKIGKTGKKNFVLFAIFLLFITLLRSPVPYVGHHVGYPTVGAGLFDSNPAIRQADNTQTLHFFSLPAGGVPPADLQVDSNQLIRAADKITPPETAGGLALWKDAVNRPLNFNDERRDWPDELIEKIWQVESGGRINPPDGDGGEAIGPLQIHQGVLDDVNKRYGTKFCREDLRNLKTAKLIARLYISMWMEEHKEEIAARIFNGGPRGWRKKSTDSYWENIQGVK